MEFIIINYFTLLKPVFLNLPWLFSIVHLECSSVLSRVCFKEFSISVSLVFMCSFLYSDAYKIRNRSKIKFVIMFCQLRSLNMVTHLAISIILSSPNCPSFLSTLRNVNKSEFDTCTKY